MTAAEVQAWLSTRQPAPPSALAERLDALLTCFSDRLTALSGLSDSLAAVALWTLDSLEGRDPRAESVALDLLAADAFVTYAFEAAAEAGEDVGQVAETVLARLGA